MTGHSQDFMPQAERIRRARSFASVAAEYERGRPGYPPEAITWILGADAVAVLDVGAGTGKLTAAVLALGHPVIAVEPLAEMRTVLESRLANARVLQGSAEELPLGSESVDAVVVGAAFHWFEQEQALLEIARVLRAPGVLGLLGNSFDMSVPWQAELRQILGPATLGRRRRWPEPARLQRTFEQVDDREFSHVQPITLAQLRDYASSRSGFAVLPAWIREQRLEEIDSLWERTPALRDAPEAELRWITTVRRCAGLADARPLR